MAINKNGRNSLAYTGVSAGTPPNVQMYNRAPGVGDYRNFTVGDLWIHEQQNNLSDAYILVGVAAKVAKWVKIGESLGTVETLTGNSGGAVSPDGAGDITVIGDESTGITVIGIPGSNELLIKSTINETFTVQTIDATPTTLFSRTVAEGEAIVVYGEIVGAVDDYSASIMGNCNGGVRRVAAGATTLVGSPLINFSEDAAGSPSYNIIVTGNDVIVQVIGEGGTTYNWKGQIKILVQDT